MVPENHFRKAFVQLFREAFEGRPHGQDYTWFVEGKEGIFDALDSLTAEAASRKPSERCASIAAHAYHIRFALQAARAEILGEELSGDWESSWLKQSVTPTEWALLIGDIRAAYAFLIGQMEANSDWSNPDMVIGALAQLPHMAFHLGAIRQLMKL
ncbi:MAG: hypothetical protein KIS66_14040 [Fimbriimonadaceae bacterium]|nr:hypothetical protein [Fimbriimonadaceae bacterium]